MSYTQESGYVYFITQKNQVTSPGHRCGWKPLVKIGKTKNPPTRRLLQAEQAFPNKTWLSGSFKVEKAIYVENMTQVEDLIHLMFEEYHEYEKGYGKEWYVYFPEKVDILLKLLLNGSKTNILWTEVEEIPIEVEKIPIEDKEIPIEVEKIPIEETKETEPRAKTKKQIKNERIRKKRKMEKNFKNQCIDHNEANNYQWRVFKRKVKSGLSEGTEQSSYKPPKILFKNKKTDGSRMSLKDAMEMFYSIKKE
jgi:hypothetical protein